MIVAIGSFRLKKRSLLPQFLKLSKKIYQQALVSKGNLACELDNEGIQVFYSFTHWNNLENMQNFVHQGFHETALKETEYLCASMSFLYYDSDSLVDLATAKMALANSSKTRTTNFV